MQLHSLSIEKGKPENEEHRLEKELRCYAMLEACGIAYERIDHAPMATVEDCTEVEKMFGIPICKNLFLCNTQKTRFYLLVLNGHKRFRTREVSEQLKSPRLSFGNPALMESFLDVTPGSVSLLGLMNDRENQVQLVMDRALLEEEFLAFHPCINTSSLKIRTRDIMDTILPQVHHEAIFVDISD